MPKKITMIFIQLGLKELLISIWFVIKSNWWISTGWQWITWALIHSNSFRSIDATLKNVLKLIICSIKSCLIRASKTICDIWPSKDANLIKLFWNHTSPLSWVITRAWWEFHSFKILFIKRGKSIKKVMPRSFFGPRLLLVHQVKKNILNMDWKMTLTFIKSWIAPLCIPTFKSFKFVKLCMTIISSINTLNIDMMTSFIKKTRKEGQIGGTNLRKT